MSEIDKALETAQYKYKREIEQHDKSLSGISLFLRVTTLIAAIASVLLVLNGIQETKVQSLTNQKYLRCIVLLPPDSFRGTTIQRAAAIDRCAAESQPKLRGINITSQNIITGAVILSGVAIVGSVLISQKRYKILGGKIDEVHSEVKTANSLSIAQLADADESRRIDKIPKNKQTEEEKEHTKDLNK